MHISKNLLGIFYMVTGTFFLTTMAVIVRHVAGDLHIFEIAFFRNIFGLIMLLPLLIKSGISSLRTKNMGGMALRGIFHTGGMLFYFMALTLIPLAQLSALTFLGPIVITSLAVLILGEKLGWRRFSSLVIGFTGALIIIRPGMDYIALGVIYALASVFSWAGAVIVIKRLSKTNSTVTTTIYGLFFLTLFTFFPAVFVWSWPTVDQLMWLLLLALVGTIGQLLFTESLKVADVTLVMPFDFSKLIWASLFGFIFFLEIPSFSTFFGGAVIFLSATYVAYRERKISHKDSDEIKII